MLPIGVADLYGSPEGRMPAGFFDGFFWLCALGVALMSFADWYIEPQRRKALKEAVGWWWLQLEAIPVHGKIRNLAILYTKIMERFFSKKFLSYKRVFSSFLWASLMVVLFFSFSLYFQWGELEGDIDLEYFEGYVYFLSQICESMLLVYRTVSDIQPYKVEAVFLVSIFSTVIATIVSIEMSLRLMMYISKSDSVISVLFGVLAFLLFVSVFMIPAYFLIQIVCDYILNQSEVRKFTNAFDSPNIVAFRILVVVYPFIFQIAAFMFITFVPFAIFIFSSLFILSFVFVVRALKFPISGLFAAFYRSDKGILTQVSVGVAATLKLLQEGMKFF